MSWLKRLHMWPHESGAWVLDIEQGPSKVAALTAGSIVLHHAAGRRLPSPWWTQPSTLPEQTRHG